METKDILFTGIGRAVSDIDVPDGELSVSHNIIRDNGSMRPILLPEEKISLEEGEMLVFVHSVSGGKNYIVGTDDRLYFFTDFDDTRNYISSMDVVNTKLVSIGNTLVATSGDGLYYLLFKDGMYKNLGQKPPETVIRFILQSKLIESEKSFSSPGSGNYMESAAVNKLISDATKENHIIYPCFVRYAYRLFDGTSYVMHSSPILLVPNTDIAPVVCTTAITNNEIEGDWIIDGEWKAKAMVSKIMFQILNNELEEWKDIIHSVDIFMSEQVSTRNDGAETNQIEKLTDTPASKSVNYGWFPDFNLSQSGPMSFFEAIGSEANTVILYDDSMVRKDFKQIIAGTSIFYKVRSIEIDSIDTSKSYSLFEDDENGTSGSGVNLSTITLESRLPDDYQTHDVLVPDYMFAYNKRLNISGLKRILFKGYNTSSMVADVVYPNCTSEYWTVYTHIKKNGNEIVVKNECLFPVSFYPMYLFYPDTDAYKMTIIKGSDVVDGSELNDGYVLSLTSHTGLNGSVYFNALNPAPNSSVRRLSAPFATESSVDIANKVYTSEVNNPFYFPLEGINTVGSGNIVGMASVTQALSQGQFGQFPLYVFASDGVWAMEVGDDGLYRSIKPISRDVCINGNSITQTDNAVLFVTEKGVMMIDGSEISCISEMMNGRSFDVDSVAMLREVMVKEGVSSGLNGINDFMDYARKGKMVYDYPNGRILLYSEGTDYAYVFSLGSATWATLGISIDGSVADYPDAYIQTGSVVRNLSERIDYNNTSEVGTLIVTRPVKLGSDEYKTVYEMVSRGTFKKCRGALLLWGSYDGENYTLVADSCGNRLYRTGGSGYRYFRIGIVGNMCVGETLSMVSVGFRRKYGNRLR